MNYTKEELEIMDNNLKKVEKWINEKIMPYIRDKIEINYNENYCLIVSPRDQAIGYAHQYGGCNVRTEKGFVAYCDRNREDAYCRKYLSETDEVLNNWHMLKGKLIMEMEKQKKKYESVYNFEL